MDDATDGRFWAHVEVCGPDECKTHQVAEGGG